VTLPQLVSDAEPILTRTSSVGVPAGTIIVDFTLASLEELDPSKDALTQVAYTGNILNSSAFFVVLTVRGEGAGSNGVRQFTLLSLNVRKWETTNDFTVTTDTRATRVSEVLTVIVLPAASVVTARSSWAWNQVRSGGFLTDVIFTDTILSLALAQLVTVQRDVTLPQLVCDAEPILTCTSSVGVPAGTIIVDITLTSPEEWIPSKDTLAQVTDTGSILNSSAIFMVLTVRGEGTGTKGVRQFTLRWSRLFTGVTFTDTILPLALA